MVLQGNDEKENSGFFLYADQTSPSIMIPRELLFEVQTSETHRPFRGQLQDTKQPFTEMVIIKEAYEDDLMVMGSKGRTGLDRLLAAAGVLLKTVHAMHHDGRRLYSTARL